jgi:hypothetical protein
MPGRSKSHPRVRRRQRPEINAGHGKRNIRHDGNELGVGTTSFADCRKITFRNAPMLAGSFVLTFGTSIRQDWTTAGVQLIYAAILAGLLAYREGDVYSVDVLVCSRNGTALDSR